MTTFYVLFPSQESSSYKLSTRCNDLQDVQQMVESLIRDNHVIPEDIEILEVSRRFFPVVKLEELYEGEAR